MYCCHTEGMATDPLTTPFTHASKPFARVTATPLPVQPCPRRAVSISADIVDEVGINMKINK